MVSTGVSVLEKSRVSGVNNIVDGCLGSFG